MNKNFIDCYNSLKDAYIELNSLKQQRSDLYIAIKKLNNYHYHETILDIREKLLDKINVVKKKFYTIIPLKILITGVFQYFFFFLFSILTGHEINIGMILGTTIGLNSVDVIKAFMEYKKSKKKLKIFNENMLVLEDYKSMELSNLLSMSYEMEQEINIKIEKLTDNIRDYEKCLEGLEESFVEDILRKQEIDVKLDLDITHKKINEEKWVHNKRFGKSKRLLKKY